jgi:heme a synthase
LTMFHRFCVLVAVLTFPLIFAGASVTTMGAGLSVPDWPLSFGTLFPPMEGGVLYEHGHRLIAGLVALLTLVMAVWALRAERRPWVRSLTWSALGLVLVQAVAGGLTVLLRLPIVMSALHATLAQAFFALAAAIALVTAPSWERGGARTEPLLDPGLRPLFAGAVLAVLVQIVLGAAMRHLGGAPLAIPDFPLSFGRIVPPADQLSRPDVAVNFAHRLGAVAVAIVAGRAAWRAIGSRERDLAGPGWALAILLASQVLLRASVVWTGRDFYAAAPHVAVGALVLATAVVLAIRGFRATAPSPLVVPDPVPRGSAA